MRTDLLLINFLNPPVLFFFLGMVAIWLKSDLDVPQPLPKFLSIYLLLSIGFRGGVELAKSGLDNQVILAMLGAMTMAVLVPAYTYIVLRRKLDSSNAAAIAATYGSVSAVTFIAATAFLTELKVSYGGHMVAALALMESPAIIIGVALARYARARDGGEATSFKELLRDAIANGSVFVLLGSVVIGLLTGEAGEKALKPFTGDIFRGLLCLFLLDMGLVCGRRLADLKALGGFAIRFALLVPLLNATLGLILAGLLGLTMGDAMLLTVLSASASYIAVPAALRLAIPEAAPSVYVTMSLAVTFPFNIFIGLPIYMTVIKVLWS